MLNVTLVGLGAISQALIPLLHGQPGLRLQGVLVRDPQAPMTLAALARLQASLGLKLPASARQPATREATAAQGLVSWTPSPEPLGARIRAETQRWACIIRDRKITADRPRPARCPTRRPRWNPTR